MVANLIVWIAGGAGLGIRNIETGPAEGCDGPRIECGDFRAAGERVNFWQAEVDGSDSGPDLREVTAARIVCADEGQFHRLPGFGSRTDELSNLSQLLFSLSRYESEFGSTSRNVFF